MAQPRSILQLPTELLVKVFEFCEDYHWPEDPYDQYIPFRGHSNPDSLTWIHATSSAKRNICDVRLVCKSFTEASITSFATLLGHRRFCLTNTGLNDLRNIGAVKSLAPWVRTLTFGAADVAKHAATINLEMLVEESDYGEDMHRAVIAIDKAVERYDRYRRLSPAEVKKRFVSGLKAFPQLQHLRVILDDQPDYLGGCFTPEEKEFISLNLKPGQELSRLCLQELQWSDYEVGEMLYQPRQPLFTSIVLEAIREANVQIKDLRFPNDIFRPIYCSSLPDTLRTLRMTVHHFFFERQKTRPLKKLVQTPFLKALVKMKNLRDFTLCWDYDTDVGEDLGSVYLADQSYINRVFQAIQKTSPLRRLDLQGRWYINRASLIDFLTRASSLQQLILQRAVLTEDDWLNTLHDIAQLTQHRMEYLRVANVGWWLGAERNIDLEYFDAHSRSQWPYFTCVTNFGPDFDLPPDADEGASDDVDGSEDVDSVKDVSGHAVSEGT